MSPTKTAREEAIALGRLSASAVETSRTLREPHARHHRVMAAAYARAQSEILKAIFDVDRDLEERYLLARPLPDARVEVDPSKPETKLKLCPTHVPEET